MKIRYDSSELEKMVLKNIIATCVWYFVRVGTCTNSIPGMIQKHINLVKGINKIQTKIGKLKPFPKCFPLLGAV